MQLDEHDKEHFLKVSVFEILKERYHDYLRSDLLNVWYSITTKGQFLEYEVRESNSCTITYKHDINSWDCSPNEICRTFEQLVEMGFSPEELMMLLQEDKRKPDERFIEEYILTGGGVPLVIHTSLFSLDGQQRIVDENFPGE